MAFEPDNLTMIIDDLRGDVMRLFAYRSDVDTLEEVAAPGYFARGAEWGIELGDSLIVKAADGEALSGAFSAVDPATGDATFEPIDILSTDDRTNFENAIVTVTDIINSGTILKADTAIQPTSPQLSWSYANKARFEAAIIPAEVQSCEVRGYDAEWDGGRTEVTRVDAMPTDHEGWFRSADRFLSDGSTDATNGGYWEYRLLPAVPQMFGAKGDNVTDDAVALQRWATFLSIGSKPGHLPRGVYRTSQTIILNGHSVITGDSAGYQQIAWGDAAAPFPLNNSNYRIAGSWIVPVTGSFSLVNGFTDPTLHAVVKVVHNNSNYPYGATFPTLDLTTDGDQITGATITNGGSGLNTDYPLRVVVNGNGSGSGAQISLTVAGGVAISATIDNPGSGYSGSPTATVSDYHDPRRFCRFSKWGVHANSPQSGDGQYCAMLFEGVWNWSLSEMTLLSGVHSLVTLRGPNQASINSFHIKDCIIGTGPDLQSAVYSFAGDCQMTTCVVIGGDVANYDGGGTTTLHDNIMWGGRRNVRITGNASFGLVANNWLYDTQGENLLISGQANATLDDDAMSLVVQGNLMMSAGQDTSLPDKERAALRIAGNPNNLVIGPNVYRSQVLKTTPATATYGIYCDGTSGVMALYDTQASFSDMLIGNVHIPAGVTLYGLMNATSGGAVRQVEPFAIGGPMQALNNLIPPALLLRGETEGESRLGIYNTGTNQGTLMLGRNDPGSGDVLGDIDGFSSVGGVSFKTGARIRLKALFAHDTDDRPSQIEFYTTLDNTDTLVRRMTIEPTGDILIGSNRVLTRTGLPVVPMVTTAELEDRLSGVNAAGKRAGAMAYDTTVQAFMVATGSATTSPWEGRGASGTLVTTTPV